MPQWMDQMTALPSRCCRAPPADPCNLASLIPHVSKSYGRVSTSLWGGSRVNPFTSLLYVSAGDVRMRTDHPHSGVCLQLNGGQGKYSALRKTFPVLWIRACFGLQGVPRDGGSGELKFAVTPACGPLSTVPQHRVECCQRAVELTYGPITHENGVSTDSRQRSIEEKVASRIFRTPKIVLAWTPTKNHFRGLSRIACHKEKATERRFQLKLDVHAASVHCKRAMWLLKAPGVPCLKPARKQRDMERTVASCSAAR
jgi:hypothetical protein